ncbi:MAG: hypothetical protein AAF004_15230 [Pseudomonadota bacterium]
MLAGMKLAAAIGVAKSAALFDRVRQRTARRRIRQMRQRFYTAYWQRIADSTNADLTVLGGGFTEIDIDGKKLIVRGAHVPIDNMVTLRLARDKNLVGDILLAAGIPVTDGSAVTLSNWREKRVEMHSNGAPVVLKPAGGSGGRGVTTDVRSTAEFEAAFAAAYVHDRTVRMEPFISGVSYRLLFINGELVETIRRESPHVVGDGRSTITALVAAENARRQTEPRRGLSQLTIDLDAKIALSRQSLTLGSAPRDGQRVLLKHACNQNSADENSRFDGTIHESYRDVGRRVFDLTGIALLGLDVISEDMSLSFDETGSAINEINTTPALHHHDIICNGDGVALGLRVLHAAIALDPRWASSNGQKMTENHNE